MATLELVCKYNLILLPEVLNSLRECHDVWALPPVPGVVLLAGRLAVVHGGGGAEVPVQQGRHLPLHGHQRLVVLSREITISL